jgi:uncharacterized protein (DUF1697 family)
VSHTLPAVARHVVLLRDIKVGGRNRTELRKFRGKLRGAGFEDVETYESWNIIVTSPKTSKAVATQCQKLMASLYGLRIGVVARKPHELARIVTRNPLGEVATDLERYHVTFLSERLSAKVVGNLERVAAPPEQIVVMGREVYSWHPLGVGRSTLWVALTRKNLGVSAITRRWPTVEALLALSDG